MAAMHVRVAAALRRAVPALLAFVVLVASGLPAAAAVGLPVAAGSLHAGHARGATADCGSLASVGTRASPEGGSPSTRRHHDAPYPALACSASLHCPALSDGLSEAWVLLRPAPRALPRRGGGDAASPGLDVPPTLPPPRRLA